MKATLTAVDVSSAKLAYRLFGEGKGNFVVIETALGSCSAEWWHLAEIVGRNATVLTYDRAGYGKSSQSSLSRTPKNIAKELFYFLGKLGVSDKVLLVGHSQGGLYAQQFARDYPDMVHGLVLIDPLSANDSSFSALLTAKEYAQSGVDKTKTLKLGATLCNIGLGPLFKPMIKKGVPFYYYKGFSKEAEDYLLTSLTKASHYKTALAEYRLAHEDSEVNELKDKTGFPDIPITLITHNSSVAIEEIINFGGATKEVAEKVEQIWQQLMKEYLSFSAKTKWLQAENSSHFVHLTESDLVLSCIKEMI